MFRILLWFMISPLALAKPLLILHTNDLHGYLEHSVYQPNQGGYARVRQVIDREKAKYREKGIDSLVLDAGDFMEGNMFYLVGNGERVWRSLGLIGYDAVVMGNHDYLMGPRSLNQLLKNAPPPFAYLGTNLKMSVGDTLLYPNLVQETKSHAFFNKGGVKIAVMGLTTNQIVYSWTLKKKVKIRSPMRTAKRVETKLKELGADFVFALTHLGFKKDLKLVRRTEHIDLVVGGHSHTLIDQPLLERNKNNLLVPIVQAGSHGKYVGKLLVDLEKGQPLKILSYQLIPVDESVPGEPELEAYVSETRELLEEEYGRDYLDEFLGLAEIPLIHSRKDLTPWTALLTDALRESVDADISFHSPFFGGANLPAGPVTREDIFQSHPRVFNFKNRKGWKIYKVKILGLFLRPTIKLILRNRLPVSFSGVDFDIVPKAVGGPVDFPRGRFKVRNLRIKGEKVKYFKRYSVALNEGIVEGALGISRLVNIFVKSISRTPISVWEAISLKVKEVGAISRDYGRSDGQMKQLGKNFIYKAPHRMFRPALVQDDTNSSKD